ncbi:peptidoglycan-binding protein [Paracoccaceae bacterium]|nr:peptidoglycan-binding protein [Paracoccaceae bacterium]
MSKLSLKVLLGVFALMFSASVGLSADCEADANSCTPKQLCQITTKSFGDALVWNNSLALAGHLSIVQESGLNCGDVQDICDLDPEQCTLNQVCERATTNDDGKLNWNFDNLDHVVLAKEYGLACNVGKDVAEAKQSASLFSKEQFNQLDIAERKKVQYGLKELGYYQSAVDGQWGKGTQKAISSYITDRKLISDFPDSLYSSLASEVELGSLQVPTASLESDKVTNNENLPLANSVWEGELCQGRKGTITFTKDTYRAECEKNGIECGGPAVLGEGTYEVRNGMVRFRNKYLDNSVSSYFRYSFFSNVRLTSAETMEGKWFEYAYKQESCYLNLKKIKQDGNLTDYAKNRTFDPNSLELKNTVWQGEVCSKGHDNQIVFGEKDFEIICLKNKPDRCLYYTTYKSYHNKGRFSKNTKKVFLIGRRTKKGKGDGQTVFNGSLKMTAKERLEGYWGDTCKINVERIE